MTALAPYLSAFLLEHLPRERKASPHTTDAYANSFKLLVCFVATRLHVNPVQIEIEQLDVPMILAFLEHIENDRGNTARTRKVGGDPLFFPIPGIPIGVQPGPGVQNSCDPNEESR